MVKKLEVKALYNAIKNDVDYLSEEQKKRILSTIVMYVGNGD